MTYTKPEHRKNGRLTKLLPLQLYLIKRTSMPDSFRIRDGENALNTKAREK